MGLFASALTPVWAILVSLAVVPLILLSHARPNLREAWTIGAALLKCGLVLSLLGGALAGQTVEVRLFELMPGVPLVLKADPFGVFFALIASVLWIPTSFYSIGYMRGAEEGRQTRYFASFAVCLSATIGIAFAGNLLTFLVFYELLTLATYPLVVHKESAKAIRAGRQYLVYTLTAGVLLIAASGITWALAGTMDFVPGGILADVEWAPGAAVCLFLLFLGGVGVKAGIMPIHSWLPTAMAAPTPVSALLHAVAVVKSGVFAVIRVTGFIFGTDTMARFGLNDILLLIAGTTIIIASLLAFRQDNLKRRLAYSTVGHLSYIVLGAALLTPLGMTGSLLHMASHATMKITLFFCAGAIYVNLHRESIRDLDGIAKVMPWTMGAFVVGSLGLAGVPPINGFVSKWYLALGSLEGGMLLPVAILIISGLLNIGYFFPIIHRAYFRAGRGLDGYGEASPFMVVPLVITAGLSVLLGLFPNFAVEVFNLARVITGQLFAGG
jgi:multicomponent Na+:H+ antiporter subunit D